MNIDRQAGWCVHYWHCVFIRCVGGYSLYVILKLLALFIIARGLGWVFWGLGGGVQVGGGILGCLGCLGRPTPPPGGRAGSENDTLLPMTMICDRLKFWSGPTWRSKVIIRKPWRRKNKKKKKKKKKFWQTHKAFPAGSRECLIIHVYMQLIYLNIYLNK